MLRAGWIYAAVTGGLMAVPVLNLIGLYLIWAGSTVILVLAIVAMVRGAVGRGIFLLIGAPVLVWGIWFAGMAVTAALARVVR